MYMENSTTTTVNSNSIECFSCGTVQIPEDDGVVCLSLDPDNDGVSSQPIVCKYGFCRNQTCSAWRDTPIAINHYNDRLRDRWIEYNQCLQLDFDSQTI